ncbi:glycine/betaine ABC transporter [Pontibacillus yanchengensis]|uniref:Glycine/betaine ABC transporter n=2 Tax=Pontibacillus yanchengensis TaxID=462910 RepID=A0A6I5A0G6_9BACI|nr:glycine betaine ABC transporter substrate-binding protein [Pontibacillus yanchengensis]MYL33682.1 glycine/betaine ABC transporter [Pontibacillus yanchengensis]MYL55420.1 glycine/betaine ABC transporter [Pontibacillus yanchengensis]
MNNFKKLIPALFLGMLLLLAACGGGGNEEGSSGDNTEGNGETSEEGTSGEKGEIKIGLNNWAENVAVSNMWKVILENKGYTVDLTQVEKGALYTALEGGDLDVGLEVWLPNTDKPFYEQYKDSLAWHDVWFEGTTLGLAVPSYVEDVNSMNDLKGKADMFGGKIVGIDAGASLMKLTQDALKDYELENYELQSSSGPVMTAELGKAVEDEEPILVTLWKPHWVFAEYDVKFLEDSKKVYGEKEDINWVSRKAFADDQPQVTESLNTWKMDDQSLGSLMNTIKKEGDPAVGAKKWVENNQDLVKEWTSSIE